MWKDIENFKQSEFDSPDKKGSGENMQMSFIEKLDQAREIAGTPFNISSGYRTPEHNKKVGGVKDSSHVTGWAADIKAPTSASRFKILQALLHVGFDRIGVGRSFIHVDSDPKKPANMMWTYTTLKDIES